MRDEKDVDSQLLLRVLGHYGPGQETGGGLGLTIQLPIMFISSKCISHEACPTARFSVPPTAMPRTPIPSEITREDVLRAIHELSSGSVRHEFHESELYDLIHEGERYAPKAVLGVAARRLAGRLLKPADFSGGEGSTCFRVLRKLGFKVEKKHCYLSPVSFSYVVGREYNRRADIHLPYGGQQQGGIATPSRYPAVFLFTGDAGDSFGYKDQFREDGVFLYTGEGQTGDMKWRSGNLAIRESLKDGKQLLIFEQTRKGYVRFVGFAQYLSHHIEQKPDIEGKLRDAFVFELDVNGLDSTHPTAGKHIPDGEEVALNLSPPKTLAELRAAALLPSKNDLSSKQRYTIVHYRSEAVKKFVLMRSNGTCEGCRQPAPFLNRKKQPYLEPHHTTRRADGGPDDPAHVIALCPTCHRRVHHGFDGDKFNAELIQLLEAIEGTAIESEDVAA